MAIGPRLDLRQSQSLVMTPQLQQAIKLLALSNLEIETFIGEALESNPLLEIDAAGPELPVAEETPDVRRTTLETSPVDQLVSEGRAADDRPLDIDQTALDRDRDTGDGEWGAEIRIGPAGDDGPDIDDRGEGAKDLATHLHDQIGAQARDPRLTFIARYLIDQLDSQQVLLKEIEVEERFAAIDAEEAEEAD